MENEDCATQPVSWQVHEEEKAAEARVKLLRFIVLNVIENLRATGTGNNSTKTRLFEDRVLDFVEIYWRARRKRTRNHRARN
jgi:hypothetical protein